MVFRLGRVAPVPLRRYRHAQPGRWFHGAHEGFGYAVLLHFFPVLIFIAAFFARPGSRTLALAGALVLVTLVQPVWVSAFRGESLATLHVLGAAVILGLAHAVAQRATALRQDGAVTQVQPQ
jgi:hypothetical protein